MIDLRDLLERVRDAIREHESLIAFSKGAMRCGLGPYDLEPTRVRLADLRRAEKLLRFVIRGEEDPLVWSLLQN